MCLYSGRVNLEIQVEKKKKKQKKGVWTNLCGAQIGAVGSKHISMGTLEKPGDYYVACDACIQLPLMIQLSHNALCVRVCVCVSVCLQVQVSSVCVCTCTSVCTGVGPRVSVCSHFVDTIALVYTLSTVTHGDNSVKRAMWGDVNAHRGERGGRETEG